MARVVRMNAMGHILVDIGEEETDILEGACIYRVPNYIKAKFRYQFEPQEVFVGLFNHTKLLTNDPTNTDHSKLAIAQLICRGPSFCSSTLLINSRWEDLVELLAPDLQTSRQKYDGLELDEAEKRSADFLLTLDATFIVAFLGYSYRVADCWGYCFQRELNRSRFIAQRVSVARDLLLVENQVPMSLLLGVVKYFVREQDRQSGTQTWAESELYDLLAWYVVQVYPFHHGQNLDHGGYELEEYLKTFHREGVDAFLNCEHLLECAYLAICGPKELEQPGSDEKPPLSGYRIELPWFKVNNPLNPRRFRLPSATGLRRVGIHIKVSRNYLRMNGITFERRNHRYVILVPKLIMNNNTSTILRNLALFEQIRDDGGKHARGDMRTYLYLMSSFIDNVDDVRLLIQSGVIMNNLGSADAVCQQWDDMCDGFSLPPGPAQFWTRVSHLIDELEKSKSTRWIAEIEEKNFSSFFVFVSFLAITIVFFCTMVQATYSVLSYYHN